MRERPTVLALHRGIRPVLSLLALALLLTAACTSVDDPGGGDVARTSEPVSATTATTTSATTTTEATAGVAATALDDESLAVVDTYVDRISARIYDPINRIDPTVVERLGQLDDPSLAWLVADGLRFVGRGPELDALVEAGSRLGGIDLDRETAWLELNNHLLSTDRAAPADYLRWKRDIYIAVDPTWAPFFDDAEADVDWRLITFGGVLADRRPFGSQDTCQCIAALDDPPSLPADEIDWLNDGDPVIGVEVGGEARAYPLHIMETHELVNDSLGGERIALAYCTLCGSGQAYRLDEVDDRFQPVVLRTSGLLSRSNKIMFDLDSRSMVDTFTGVAKTGPWREAGVELKAVSTVTSLWGDWRQAHPATTVMTGLNGTGPDYPLDPLGGRDDGGPIFPVGDVDPRLFPQTTVIGVTTLDGVALAFPVVESREHLRSGGTVELGEVSLILDGTGLRAVHTTDADSNTNTDTGTDTDGDTELVSHQAFWFAWSQFNPETLLWVG